MLRNNYKLMKDNKYSGCITDNFDAITKRRYEVDDLKYFIDCFNEQFRNEINNMLNQLDVCNTLDEYKKMYSMSLNNLILIQDKLKKVLKKTKTKDNFFYKKLEINYEMYSKFIEEFIKVYREFYSSIYSKKVYDISLNKNDNDIKEKAKTLIKIGKFINDFSFLIYVTMYSNSNVKDPFMICLLIDAGAIISCKVIDKAMNKNSDGIIENGPISVESSYINEIVQNREEVHNKVKML